MFLWEEGIPPRRIVLEPFLEPRHLGTKPLDLLVVVEHMVVLTCYLHKGHITTQQLQSSKHLQTLDDGHIRIDRTMQQ